MTTKNRRVVGYFPGEDYQRFREWQQEQGLTESGALVRIVQQFLGTSPQTREQPWQREIGELRERVLALERRASMKGKGSSSYSSSFGPKIERRLDPITAQELAHRCGCDVETVLSEAAKGQESFEVWCLGRDPQRKQWRLEGQLFYPVVWK